MSWNWVPLPRRVRLPETPRLVLTLGIAGLLSGFAIVGAYRLTLPVIQENQAAALEAAVFEVVPESERLERLVVRDGALVRAADVPAAAAAADEPSVYAAYTEDGRFLGYAVPSAGPGFQDTIRLLYGYDPEADRIVGMQILESRETPGLGDRIYKDREFVDQFRDLAVLPRVELVKEAATAANQVDAITGATISSAAVVKIINAGNDRWLERLEGSPPPPLAGPGTEAPGPVLEEQGGPIPGGRQ